MKRGAWGRDGEGKGEVVGAVKEREREEYGGLVRAGGGRKSGIEGEKDGWRV